MMMSKNQRCFYKKVRNLLKVCIENITSTYQPLGKNTSKTSCFHLIPSQNSVAA